MQFLDQHVWRMFVREQILKEVRKELMNQQTYLRKTQNQISLLDHCHHSTNLLLFLFVVQQLIETVESVFPAMKLICAPVLEGDL